MRFGAPYWGPNGPCFYPAGFALAPPCPRSSPQQGFLQNSMVQAEGSYYALAVPPLFKSQTDLPAAETPTAQGWSVGPSSLGSIYPTVGLWERAFPPPKHVCRIRWEARLRAVGRRHDGHVLGRQEVRRRRSRG